MESKGKVIVAHDRRSTVDELARKLEREGYRVEKAEDILGLQALINQGESSVVVHQNLGFMRRPLEITLRKLNDGTRRVILSGDINLGDHPTEALGLGGDDLVCDLDTDSVIKAVDKGVANQQEIKGRGVKLTVWEDGKGQMADLSGGMRESFTTRDNRKYRD